MERQLNEQRRAYEQAQAALAGLQEQRQKAQAEEQLIIGMFSRARAALDEGRYQDALIHVRNLQAYLQGLVIGSSSSARLDTDLYMAASLERAALAALAPADTTTNAISAELADSRQQAALLVAQLNAEAEQARRQLADNAATALARQREIEGLRAQLEQAQRQLAALETENRELAKNAEFIPKSAQDGHREGVTNATDIVNTALRISDKKTRTQYLQGKRKEYRNNPEMTALVDVLLERLAAP
jgi:hypothetical protein